MYGQYRVVERIAVGGMAEIYRGVARGSEGFERSVVIKRVHPRFSQDRRFVEMLIREAKITARLTHPNIVQILDLGRYKGEYFIVMEHVEGHDLAAVMNRARKRDVELGLDTMLYLTAEICDALDHAHRLTDEQGHPLSLIHRDVSPSNVLLSTEGEVKLTDFGVARFGRDVSLVGSLKGKLAYMSPEQARAQRIDHRSDIFSVGAVLFELLLGRRVFAADTDIEMLNVVRQAQIPRPSTIDPSISTVLERILLRALAPVDGRYQTAGELSAALKALRFEVSSARVGASEVASLLKRLFGDNRPKRGEAARFTIDRLAPLREPSASEPSAAADAVDDDEDLAPSAFADRTNPDQPSAAVLEALRNDRAGGDAGSQIRAAATEPGVGGRAPMVEVITGIHDIGGEGGEEPEPAGATERYAAVGIDETDTSVTQVEAVDLAALDRQSAELEAARFDAGAILAAERTDPEIPAARLGVRASFDGLGPVLSRRMTDESASTPTKPAKASEGVLAPSRTAPETPSTRSGRRGPPARDAARDLGAQRPGSAERHQRECRASEDPEPRPAEVKEGKAKWDPLAPGRRALAKRVALPPTAEEPRPAAEHASPFDDETPVQAPADRPDEVTVGSGQQPRVPPPAGGSPLSGAPIGPFSTTTLEQGPSPDDLAAAQRPDSTGPLEPGPLGPQAIQTREAGLLDQPTVPGEQSVPMVEGSFSLPADAVPRPLGESQPDGAPLALSVGPVAVLTAEPRRKRRSAGRLPVLVLIALAGLAIGLGGAYLVILLVKKPPADARRAVAAAAAPGADAAADRAVVDGADRAADVGGEAAVAAAAADASVAREPAAPEEPVAAKVEKPKPDRPPVVRRPPRVKRPPRVAKPAPMPGLRPYRPRPRPKPTKPKPAARGYGKLVIKSDPWAYIHVDGRNTKKVTSSRPLRLPAGRRRIKLVNPALNLQKTLVVEVLADGVVRKFVSLR